ncbi:hypothetical protein K6U62_21160 [Vibrio vulnificus]|nr:hypothetical protein [Vibrio vulnificus]
MPSGVTLVENSSGHWPAHPTTVMERTPFNDATRLTDISLVPPAHYSGDIYLGKCTRTLPDAADCVTQTRHTKTRYQSSLFTLNR